jgi:hypothetical protein
VLPGRGTRYAEGCCGEGILVKGAANGGYGCSSRAGVWAVMLQVGQLQGGVMRAGFLRVKFQQRGVLWCGESFDASTEAHPKVPNVVDIALISLRSKCLVAMANRNKRTALFQTKLIAAILTCFLTYYFNRSLTVRLV